MRSLRILPMALLFAFVHAAIEFALAEVATLEHAGPAFDDRFITIDGVFALALPLISTITAKQLLLDMTAIAPG